MTISRNLSFLAEGVSSTGVLGATYGGTGQSSITTGDLLYGSASNTISKLAIGSTGTVLRVVAGVPSWGTDYTGTVTSVAATVPSFLSISGSPITSSGTLAITLSGTALPVANGGTGATTLTGYVYGNGTGAMTASTTIPTSSLSGTINLATQVSGTLPVGNGGTGLTTLTAGYIPYGNGTSAFNSSSNLYFDGNNLGIGTSSPNSGYRLDVVGNSGIRISGGTVGSVAIRSAATYANFVNFNESGVADRGVIGFAGGNSGMQFRVNGAYDITSGTEAMRIDSSGNLLVNTTTQFGSGKICNSFDGTVYNGTTFKNTNSGNSCNYEVFYNSAAGVAGYINQVNATTVAFVTVSDYRLKENVAPMTGSLDKILQLNPVTYTWKENGTNGQGFIAHELQEIIPDCVVGKKDNTDQDGNPVYQGIDTSFLVATLTSAIQELKQQFDAYVASHP